MEVRSATDKEGWTNGNVNATDWNMADDGG